MADKEAIASTRSKVKSKIDGLAKTPVFGNRRQNLLIISRGYFSDFSFSGLFAMPSKLGLKSGSKKYG
ncbi:MAG: hypothetical protein LBE01_02050 [Deltaproteobacteria bacterium]|jgi:hypothetical protein|nr:hypothetical protein [Deltaproteobacteria bacterium]